MRVQLGELLQSSLEQLLGRLSDGDSSKRPLFVIALTLQDGCR